MTRHDLTPEQQMRLREEGLLADVHEPFVTESGLRLDAFPRKPIKGATRRQRGDRIVNAERERLGLPKTKPKR